MEVLFMKKNETKLLASRAVNKIGNVMYDYGNSTWIAGLGSIGQKYMGYYQLAENVISLFLNPIGGAVADRFKRRQILLVTDFIGGLMCAVLAFIGNDNIMLYGLIAVNAALAIMSAFSGTSFRSYVAPNSRRHTGRLLRKFGSAFQCSQHFCPRCTYHRYYPLGKIHVQSDRESHFGFRIRYYSRK